ncbi:Conserved hypothetical protein [gamma proteobacterium HdN1]|nr:Conserved hypothetical protein [gamma proteobacterium HdN1]
MAIIDDKKKAEPATNQPATPAATTSPNAGKALDFGDLKPVWGKLIDKNRPGAESNLLRITTRSIKLDPIAELALAKVKQTFSANESALRKLISSKGYATEIDRVTKRLNRQRISENKRVVLALVYPYLLNTLLSCNDADQEIKDETGFAEAVLFELERENGPLDVFSKEVVKLVGAKHRIDFAADNVLRDLVAYQVRAAL